MIRRVLFYDAIVTMDVSDYAIVADIPAKVIGQREIKDYQYGYKG